MSRLVLASKSPRRRVLLQYLVAEFDVQPVDVNEVAPRALTIPDALEVIARKKAMAASLLKPDQLALGGDTVVSYRGKLVGKAHSESDARAKLAMLSDDEHEVVTGLAMAYDGRALDDAQCITSVSFDRLPSAVVDDYVRRALWAGKAGAYGVQDAELARFIHVTGSWSNVVGLPLAQTAALLTRNDIACMEPPTESWLQDHNPFDAPPR